MFTVIFHKTLWKMLPFLYLTVVVETILGVVTKFWLLQMNLLSVPMHRIFGGCMYVFLFVIFSGVGFLSHRLYTFNSFFVDSAKEVLKSPAILHTQPLCCAPYPPYFPLFTILVCLMVAASFCYGISLHFTDNY